MGKLAGNALYIHSSALPEVPAVLRLYEGCARAVVGTVDEANLIKLHRNEAKVSYLAYPDFDSNPHPELEESLVWDLQQRTYRVTSYPGRRNPPILHRKEAFVGPAHPQRKTFQRLTAQEERFGLYDEPAEIGTLEGWERTLQDHGVRLHGHRVVRNSATK